jgi:hypothetical protein
MSSTTARTWSAAPAREEVEAEIRRFFSLLAAEKIGEAEASVSHEFGDWNSQVWSLWQDVVIFDGGRVLSTETLERGEHLRDTTWLRRIGIENQFHWSGDSLFVNLTIDGEVCDVSADFCVRERDARWMVVRQIIHVA